MIQNGIGARPSDAKPRIAILEDHDDTREFLLIALEAEFCCSGFSEATKLLDAVENGHFAGIIADIMLPVVDGCDFIEKLRANPRFATLPVIAVTGLACGNDRDRAMSAGFTDYLVKPISTEEIARIVWRSLKGGSIKP